MPSPFCPFPYERRVPYTDGVFFCVCASHYVQYAKEGKTLWNYQVLACFLFFLVILPFFLYREIKQMVKKNFRSNEPYRWQGNATSLDSRPSSWWVVFSILVVNSSGSTSSFDRFLRLKTLCCRTSHSSLFGTRISHWFVYLHFFIFNLPLIHLLLHVACAYIYFFGIHIFWIRVHNSTERKLAHKHIHTHQHAHIHTHLHNF